MSTDHALILAPFSDSQLARLRQEIHVAHESWMKTRKLYDPDELAQRLLKDGSSILVIESDFAFEETFAQVPGLKFVGICRAATNHVDLEAASEKGIVVVNTPGRNARAVAEHTLGLMLALARKIPQSHNYVKEGSWQDPTEPYTTLRGIELQGRAVGVIGLGAIGLMVAEICHALGMEVLGYDPYADPNVSYIKQVELDELLKQADFIDVHVPLTPQTLGTLNAERLALVKPTAYVISASDAAVFEGKALADALIEKRIAGAALDVFESHPVSPQNPLLALDNVVLTPHIGGATEETVERHSRMMTDDILRFVNGQSPLNLVNPDAWQNRT
ncbi:MAG: hypothetical protein BZY79_02465 [SAR202 cluster bacterium Casp-Chloro-G4]|nr:NAD(P)-dependent oxidoreductase [Chloroflexota bacterium]MDA1228001.1 NAD(P)-dependent oxidoreductase [Chloroflexota bacterium]PKB61694.1 MAG: hypothetical protein BZY79_02465 [SAR202 cluster bacterium Casp-Chloro-G4]